jgi:hypothetical protein
LLLLLCGELRAHLGRDDLELAGAAEFVRELLLGAGDGVLVFVEQLLDAQDHLHVALAVGALAGAVLLRREHRELRFPVAQHVRLDARDLAHLSDLEEELFGDGDCRRVHRLKPFAEAVLLIEGC